MPTTPKSIEPSCSSPSVDLHCVPPEQVKQFWPHVAPLLKRAIEKCGDWTLEELQEGLFDGPFLLWVTSDGQAIFAAAVTALIKVPRGLVCQAIACGGSDDDWPLRFEGIEQYARNEGCVATRVYGRPGWSRVFKDYKMEWVSLEKRLA